MILTGDSIIIVAYVAAIICFKKYDLIHYLILFLSSVAIFEFSDEMMINCYQLHLVYLIIFSFSCSRYKDDKKKMIICLLMVLFQGITAIDAYIYSGTETSIYFIYPIVIGIIHFAFICSSFRFISIRKYIEFNINIIRNIKIN